MFNILILLALLTILKEIRMMSHELLRSHNNIVRLLGISWASRRLRIVDQPIQVPVLLVELASTVNEQPLTLELLIESSRDYPLNIQIKTKLLSDVASGLTALHSLSVVHGDVKPSNILIFKDDLGMAAKISDFGFSVIGDEELQAARGGTYLWNAPECLINAQGNPHTHRYKVTRDYYSFGLLIW
jgi:serine/threonine protein kinase